jgi:hypothetical protein
VGRDVGLSDAGAGMVARSDRDAHWTPAEGTRHLLRWCPEVLGQDVWEPCAGAGWMRDTLRDEGGCLVRASDIVPMGEGIEEMDALARQDRWHGWIVTNPPFNLAIQIAQHALSLSPRVALLVRLSFLEPTRERGPFLARRPPDRVIITPRMRFPRGDGLPQRGTDSVTTAWLVWGVAPGRVIVSTKEDIS